jgi:hypothetical protein
VARTHEVMRRETIFRITSATKPIVATAATILVVLLRVGQAPLHDTGRTSYSSDIAFRIWCLGVKNER